MLPKAIDAMLDATTPEFPRYWAATAMDTFRAGHLVSISRDLMPSQTSSCCRTLMRYGRFLSASQRTFRRGCLAGSCSAIFL